jgi:hypothetical protein
LPRPALLLCAFTLCIAKVPTATGQGTAIHSPKVSVSQISADLAIVAEVSLDAPYVGQQFSILYKLRAQRPPAAVDIEPQQYSGFWTELIPVSPESAASARVVKGQGAVDYLLRQVIAYPLFEGRQKLPALSVKVKGAGNISARPDDWDLLGSSAPLEMEIVPLPPTSQATSGAALVGAVAGKMSRAHGDQLAVILEIEGTANLALFKPLDWLHLPAGLRLHAQLTSADKQPQTVDIEGRRQLSLLQRQRWLLSAGETEAEWRVDGLFLPVFDPDEKVWKNVSIEGLAVPGTELSPGDAGIAGKGSVATISPARRRPQSSGLVAIFIILGAVIVMALLLWIRRKRARADLRWQASIAVLEKKLRTSPRNFTDAAHKVLARYAVEMHRDHDLGAEDTLLDRCWITVQKHRFTVEPVTIEACNEMFQTIKQVLLSLADSK